MAAKLAWPVVTAPQRVTVAAPPAPPPAPKTATSGLAEFQTAGAASVVLTQLLVAASQVPEESEIWPPAAPAQANVRGPVKGGA